MKNILLIGVGGAGSETVDVFDKLRREFGQQNDNNISAIVFDTDLGDIQKIDSATPIPMADPASVGTICDRIGKRYLREWFPCDDKAVRAQEMVRGASQWRKKSYLAFLNLMNKPELRNRFIGALEKMVADPNAPCEVYVISSVAGGTGSGSFIPIALYAKKFLRRNLGKDPIVNAMIQLPDIFKEMQAGDNRIKVVANAYAILRELNAINLVARNYNEGSRFDRKRAKINIRIGSPEEPNVGVLFDSNNEEYWTPSAAPFSQVFMLDKMVGVSPKAHNIVLANALYSMICTKTGDEIDSEASNHELNRSQNNGANAVFAAIATSQISFPSESVLNYLAHRKVLESCNEEWLILYRAAEKVIKDRQKQAKERGVRYVMKDGEYAEIILGEYEKLVANGKINITEIIDFGTKESRESSAGTISTTYSVNRFYETLGNYIATKLPDKQKIAGYLAEHAEKVPKKLSHDAIVELAASDLYPVLLKYFNSCFETRLAIRASVSDSVLSFDALAGFSKNDELSIEENILKYKDGAGRKYVHPLAAITQLCRLKKAILNDKEIANLTPWEERRQAFKAIPSELVTLSAPTAPTKSKYYTFGEDRFSDFGKRTVEPKAYGKKTRTSLSADYKKLCEDASDVLDKIYAASKKQLKYAVMKIISANVDLLIEKYREFFKRFEKERKTLEELTADALYMDSGMVNGVVNVLSSKVSKEKIAKAIIGNAGSETEEDLAEMYDIVGKSVYATVYAAAAAARRAQEDEEETDDKKFNDKASATYRSLFDKMISSYKKFYAKQDVFKEIGDSSVVQAIEMECEEDATKEAIAARMHEYFQNVAKLATPSVRCKNDGDRTDLVSHSPITVYMMSKGTAQYIKRRIPFYEISIPAGKTSEEEILEACADGFVKKFSGDQQARTVIAPSMSDGTIYCTCDIMDISPVLIEKFDELYTGEDAYYKAYREAVERSEKFDTDMWNPHLGFNWHKRGYLPYLNDAMEEICDRKMAKALIYALANGELYLDKLAGNTMVFRTKDGTALSTETGNPINLNNVAQLVNWVRNHDDFVEEFSKAFDELVAKEKAELPNITSNQKIINLKTAITKSDFIHWMEYDFFAYPAPSGKVPGVKNKVEADPAEKKEGASKKPMVRISIPEFAYLVKVSEESTRDNDDAERILTVAFETFKDYCACRTTPETNIESYVEIYTHELNNVFKYLAASNTIYESKEDGEDQFDQIVSWLNSAGMFLGIDKEDPIESDGHSIKYRSYEKSLDVIAALKKTTKDAKSNTGWYGLIAPRQDEKAGKAEKAEKAETEEAEEIAEEADAEGTTETKKKAKTKKSSKKSSKKKKK